MKPWLQAIIVGNPAPTTQTFTSNTTWNCPLDVSRLEIVRGEGADGTPDTPTARSASSVSVIYATSGSGSQPVSNDWSNMQARANFNQSAMAAGGNVSYGELNLIVYAGGTETSTATGINLSNVIAGTASTVYSGGWSSSGPITSSGTASINYQEMVPAAPGAASTAFGLSFPGGAANTPASPVDFQNVAVTPGTAYSIVVPAGGFITITYYR